MVQYQQGQGKDDHIHHAPHRDGFADLQIAPQGQGQIDEQAQIAHADPRDILDHGADAVDSGGGELVGKDKKLIVDRRGKGHPGDDQIGPYLF